MPAVTLQIFVAQGKNSIESVSSSQDDTHPIQRILKIDDSNTTESSRCLLNEWVNYDFNRNCGDQVQGSVTPYGRILSEKWSGRYKYDHPKRETEYRTYVQCHPQRGLEYLVIENVGNEPEHIMATIPLPWSCFSGVDEVSCMFLKLKDLEAKSSKEAKKYQTKITALEKDASKRSEELDTAHRRQQQLQKELDLMKKQKQIELERHDATVSELRNDLKSLEKEVRVKADEIRSLREEKYAFEQQLTSTEKRLSDSKAAEIEKSQQLKEQNDALSKLSSRVDSQAASLTTAKAREANLRREHDLLQSQHQELQQEYNSVLSTKKNLQVAMHQGFRTIIDAFCTPFSSTPRGSGEIPAELMEEFETANLHGRDEIEDQEVSAFHELERMHLTELALLLHQQINLPQLLDESWFEMEKILRQLIDEQADIVARPVLKDCVFGTEIIARQELVEERWRNLCVTGVIEMEASSRLRLKAEAASCFAEIGTLDSRKVAAENKELKQKMENMQNVFQAELQAVREQVMREIARALLVSSTPTTVTPRGQDDATPAEMTAAQMTLSNDRLLSTLTTLAVGQPGAAPSVTTNNVTTTVGDVSGTAPSSTTATMSTASSNGRSLPLPEDLQNDNEQQ